MGPGVLSPGPLSTSIEGTLDVQASLSMSVAGGPVLGIFRDKPELIKRILDGLDEDMIMEIAQVLPRLAPLVDVDGAAEEKWRQFTASTEADRIRVTLEPFMEQLKRQEEEMATLFSQAFEMATRASSDPFADEPSPWEIKHWSAVIVLWIMTALGTAWVCSDFHLGVIFTVLGVLIGLFYSCFK